MMNEPTRLGPFETKDQAMLAAEADDALHGGEEPLIWRVPPHIRSEPKPGHVYQIGGPPWYAIYKADGDCVWQRDFDSEDAAMSACADDWESRDRG